MDAQTTSRRASRNLMMLAAWTLAWVLTLALARFGSDLLWPGNAVLTWVALILNLAVGAGWIIAHARYLRGVDDLQRKILMDAMALALGTGLVVGCAYAFASGANLIAVDVNIGFLSILIGLVYVLAVAIGSLRYR